MQLSPHFTLEEMTLSQVGERAGLDNTPPPEIVTNLAYTCAKMESVRALLGFPLLVSSGYRSPEVNKAVGGAADSAHMSGYAVDFICPKAGTPLDICEHIAGSVLQFDQVIQEGTWIHLSFAPTMRREVLAKQGAGYTQGL